VAACPARHCLPVAGNLCAHRECADTLLQLGLREALARLAPLCKADATVQKYVLRIQQKLQQQQQQQQLMRQR
jgi:hypothetical protein